MKYIYQVKHVIEFGVEFENAVNCALRDIDPAMIKDIKYQEGTEGGLPGFSALIIYKTESEVRRNGDD